VILVICLWLLAALSLLALGLAYRLGLEGRVIAYKFHTEEMRELAKGIVSLAAARIDAGDEDCTFHGQAWAQPLRLAPSDFGGLDDEKLKRFRAEGMVFDELGRLNINSAYRGQLRSLGVVDDEAASAILDWRDGDDAPSPMGAESSYYRTLRPAYVCKNAPFDSVYELLLVRGFTRAVLFGADGDAVRAPDGSGDRRPAAEGLRDYLTVYGDGRINLNTAPKQVLLTIPGVTPEIADEVIGRRAGQDSLERTEDDVPFVTFDELLEVGGVTQFVERQMELSCVLASDTFDVRVQVADRTNSAAVHLDVVFVRGDKGAECVSWRER